MGAIAGVVYPELQPIAGAVKPAIEVMAARCSDLPDNYLFKNVELSVRGSPVGFDQRHQTALIVDGDILNIKALSHLLKGSGYTIDGLSLPQLLIRAYEHWDRKFIEHLEGSFAIALFDQRKRELTLFRDALGIKPLYWTHQGGYFLFASELKAILATGLVAQSPAKDALGAYLHFGYIPSDLSPIEGVNKLLPGHTLRFSHARGISLKLHPCQNAQQGPISSSQLERTACLKEILEKAMQRQVPPKGQIGYVASGSSGSACLAQMLAQEGTKDRTHALALGFIEGNPEEVQTAELIARQFDLPQRTYTLSPAALLEDLVRVTWQLDEPGADPAALSLWRLCRQSQGSIHTLFCDVGSQELLTANSRFDPSLPLERPKNHASSFLLSCLKYLHLPSALRLLRHTSFSSYFLQKIANQALFVPEVLKEISPELSSAFSPDLYFKRFQNVSDTSKLATTYLHFEMRTHLTDKLLLEYDRLTCPNRITYYSPFLDPQLINFITSLPHEDTDPFERLVPQFKLPPRKSLSSFLSPYLHDAAVRRALEYLQQGTLIEAGWINRKWLKNALTGHTHPPTTFSQLWALLTLEIWFRLYINSPISLTPPTVSAITFLRRE
ncbi:MAG: hypothetical protein JSR80_08495 [Verrucomicrobia bacterium]|nr:hypothetical protein [Verrucomicrobiota bacterium]